MLYQMLSNSEERQFVVLHSFFKDVFWFLKTDLYPIFLSGLKTVCDCGQLKSPRNRRFNAVYCCGRSSFGSYSVAVSSRFSRSTKYSSRDMCDCLEMECCELVGSLFRFAVVSSGFVCGGVGVFGFSILLD
jgi:hypothetical protein